MVCDKLFRADAVVTAPFIRGFRGLEDCLAGFAVSLSKGYRGTLRLSSSYYTGGFGFAVGALHILPGTHFQGGLIG